jgi:hypothetical protein
MAVYCKKHRTRGMCFDCAKEKREASAVASNVVLSAELKPVKDYSNEGLVALALEIHARAVAYGTKELHDRAMEARIELINRLEKGK